MTRYDCRQKREKTMPMYFEPTQEQRHLNDSVHKAMKSLITPEYLRRMDDEGLYPYDAYDAWVQLGLTGLGFDSEFGGYGGTIEDLVLVSEQLGYWSYDLATAYMVPLFTGQTLLKHGRPEQKNQFLPRLVDGTLRMSVCISEPSAGSDVSAIKTKAVRDGDDWVISGQKLWITAAGARDTLLQVYAVTNPDVPAKQGISIFLIENNAPGVVCKKNEMLGRRGVGTYEVFFDQVRVHEERILGQINEGWRYLLSGLQFERVLTSSAYSGASQSVVDMAARYASERKQFGKQIIDFQAIAHMLADMQTEVSASRLLAYDAAGRLTRGLGALREVSMAKLFGSETYVKVANQGMQIMGAYGYSMEYAMQRHFRDARSTTIGAGSSQMQRNTIASTMHTI